MCASEPREAQETRRPAAAGLEAAASIRSGRSPGGREMQALDVGGAGWRGSRRRAPVTPAGSARAPPMSVQARPARRACGPDRGGAVDVPERCIASHADRDRKARTGRQRAPVARERDRRRHGGGRRGLRRRERHRSGLTQAQRSAPARSTGTARSSRRLSLILPVASRYPAVLFILIQLEMI